MHFLELEAFALDSYVDLPRAGRKGLGRREHCPGIPLLAERQQICLREKCSSRLLVCEQAARRCSAALPPHHLCARDVGTHNSIHLLPHPLAPARSQRATCASERRPRLLDGAPTHEGLRRDLLCPVLLAPRDPVSVLWGHCLRSTTCPRLVESALPVRLAIADQLFDAGHRKLDARPALGFGTVEISIPGTRYACAETGTKRPAACTSSVPMNFY